MDAERHHHAHHQRGWVRPGGRRGRWLEPFLLLLVAEGETHGYELIRRLNELGVAPAGVDVGMAYRTLRELEAEGLVVSAWMAENGAPRRAYRLTPEGASTLREWAALMAERARLIGEFLPRIARLDGGEGG
jgi:PadR family transcriptional regulator, regulatory protein PadR